MLTKDELKAIIKRHKYDDDVYTACKVTDAPTHADRAALLKHIDDTSTFANTASQGCAAAAGKLSGSLMVWGIWIWIFRHDIAQAGAWFVAHFRVMP